MSVTALFRLGLLLHDILYALETAALATFGVLACHIFQWSIMLN
jgi:hypothetical protein